ncbi:MAG: hypothetical protein AAF511_07525 [Pseudomonadota bacterium]
MFNISRTKELKPSGFRELTEEEVLSVSGGAWVDAPTKDGEGGKNWLEINFDLGDLDANFKYDPQNGDYGGGVSHTSGNTTVGTEATTEKGGTVKIYVKQKF